MHCRSLIHTIGVAAALLTMIGSAQAFDDSKYPNLKGQWDRFIVRGLPGQASFDQTKGWGNYQQAPLTPEYQKIFEDNIEDVKQGGQGTDPTYTCLPDGMPRLMNVIFPMEIVVTPKMTYFLIEYLMQQRRIYTDGRTMPADAEPSFGGYSIGTWHDTNGDGKYDELRIETRNFRGPRSYDPTGLPLHNDNKTVVQERLFISKDNPDHLHDEITTFDNALTRPWTVLKTYRRERNAIFTEGYCGVDNPHVKIGNENYMLGADGLLMPAKKGQKPPDLRHFK
jgi:hypothetical protein